MVFLLLLGNGVPSHPSPDINAPFLLHLLAINISQLSLDSLGIVVEPQLQSPNFSKSGFRVGGPAAHRRAYPAKHSVLICPVSAPLHQRRSDPLTLVGRGYTHPINEAAHCSW